MAKIVLLRHAHSIANEKSILAGRLPNISLSSQGLREATEVAGNLSGIPFHEVRISPMQRCSETIQPWINSRQISKSAKLIVDPNLNEVDYGAWSGKKLSSLARKREWKTIQEHPSSMIFPEGESMIGAQERAMNTIQMLAKTKRNVNYLLVTHGDIVKAILAKVLKMNFDDFQTLVINTASFSVIDVHSTKFRVISINSQSLEIPKNPKFALGGELRK